MPWMGNHLPWDRSAILLEVTADSGVYAIWRDAACIYVGATYDLQRRLLEHFNGSNPCIIQARPTSFGFELSSGIRRVERQHLLIQELHPICNRVCP
jgi:GIY-YIG catalytic domain